MWSKSKYTIILFLLGLSCTPPAHSTDVEHVRLLWPPPPNNPSMEFVGVFSSELDFEKTQWKSMQDSFVGRSKSDYSLILPSSVVTFEDDKVLVSEKRKGDVKVFDFKNRTVDYLFKQTLPIFEEAVDVEIDAEKNIYIADQKNQVVSVFNRELNPLHQIGEDVAFKQIEKITINKKLKRVYVSDSTLNKVFVFDEWGQLLFDIGSGGLRDQQLNSPHGMAIDSNDQLYVADTESSQIKVFDRDGLFVKVLAFRQSSDAPVLERPWDLAFDGQGRLHIIDQKKAALITCSQKGDVLFVTMASRRTNHLMGFNRPNDIHIDSNDRIYITDGLNNRFCVWQILTASYLAENPLRKKDIENLVNYIGETQKADEERKTIRDTQEEINPVNKSSSKGKSSEERKKERKYTKVVCPNCNTEYALVFIGWNSEVREDSELD